MSEPESIPEPVVEESVEEEPEVVEEIEEMLAEREEEEPELVQEVEEKVESVEEPMLPLPDTISTPHGFEIRLPAGKLDAILKSIQNTPHDGYKPIVGLNQNGQIVIDWVTV